MNIKQNVMSHTRITHDKFCSYKIQNDRQSAISIFFLIISEILHDSWSMNFCFLTLHIATRLHQGIFGDILIPILTISSTLQSLWPLATKSGFQVYQIFFYFGKYVQLCQRMTWLIFGSKQFQNGRLVAILNFINFVIFT